MLEKGLFYGTGLVFGSDARKYLCLDELHVDPGQFNINVK